MTKINEAWMNRMLWCSAVACSLLGSGGVAQAEHKDSDDGAPGHIVTTDHEVAHTSKVPANYDEPVKLFVRERVRGDQHDGPRKAVLMIHGRSVPVLPSAALDREGYDWSLELAKAGFDVFMLDFQGSGLSPRPKMDEPCNVPNSQLPLLIPNPLGEAPDPQNPVSACPPERRYLFQLVTSESDWAELNTVVDFIRATRGVDKVALVSWSQGSFRAGPYAVMNRDKVESLFLFAPIFNGSFRSTAPSPLPQPGTPMSLGTRSELMVAWNREVFDTTGKPKCEGQVEEGIQDVVWSAIMASDSIGSAWGPPPADAPANSSPEGVMRVRTPTLWGWNSTKASELDVPVLIIAGEQDTGLGGVQQLDALYRAIKHPNKLGFTVQCAGHFMQWEHQRRILHQISKQWLRHGAVEDFTVGTFFVDTEGNLKPGDLKK